MEQKTIGNYKIVWLNSGKGWVSNDKTGLFYDFFVGFDYYLYFFQNGNSVVAKVPRYIKKTIVSIERIRRRGSLKNVI
jgi:hypothetical protein